MLKTLRKKQKGSVLLLTFFLLIILALLGSGFVSLLPMEMRSAQKDRAVMQGGYGAKSALEKVMNEFTDQKPYTAIATGTASSVDMGNGWSYRVDTVTLIDPDVYRVATSASLNNVVKRRSEAIIDNGAGHHAIKFLSTTINGNAKNSLPAGVTIDGDVLVMGTATINNAGFTYNTGNPAPFRGTIFQTEPSTTAYTSGNSVGRKGEEYTVAGNKPDDANGRPYSDIYANGQDAIQPYPFGVQQEQLYLSSQTETRLLSKVFNVPSGQVSGKVSAAPAGVSVASTGAAMTGGIYFKSSGNQANEFTVKFNVDVPGPLVNGKPTAAKVATTTVTQKSGNGNNGTTTTTKITTVRKGSTLGVLVPVPQPTDTIIIQQGLSAPQILTTDIDAGHVMYIEGDVKEMSGTYSGNRTIGISNDTQITGELLKDDTIRGEKSSPASKTALGIIGTVSTGPNNVGTDFILANNTRPADDTYYMYAYLTGLDDNDTNSKMFKDSTIPNGTSIAMMGSIALQITTANGQTNKTLAFLNEGFSTIVADESTEPFAFNGLNIFIPRLRSYVDVPVGE